MNKPTFFFTAEDPREIPKTSRDPLRFLPVWSAVGRRMVPYLTTVTPSYRGFLTRFLFHGAVEKIAPYLQQASRDDQWQAFTKFEQLCGIIRTECQVKTPDFPGKTGVPGKVTNGKATIGVSSSLWLTRSQKNTGFWGYYHQASIGSEILRTNKNENAGYELTDSARQVLKSSSANQLLDDYYDWFYEIFKKNVVKVDLLDYEELAAFFAQKPYGTGEWGDFWHDHLLVPGSGNGFSKQTQIAFADNLQKIYSDQPNLNAGSAWEKLLESSTDEVSRHAQMVRASEAVIGLCEWVFDICRVRHEKSLTLAEAYDFAVENGYDKEWLDRLKHIASPDHQELIELREVAFGRKDSFNNLASVLIDRHVRIMKSRKVAPWLELQDNHLMIRRSVEPRSAPDFEKNPSGVIWRYDYFMNSWANNAREIGYLPDQSNG